MKQLTPEAQDEVFQRRPSHGRLVPGDSSGADGETTVGWGVPAASSSVATGVFTRKRVRRGEVVADRYRIRQQLGVGATGAVWLAQDDLLQRPVALKHLCTRGRTSRSTALKEARTAARVMHRGVVRVHDVLLGEDGWIVMELLQGPTLCEVIRQRRRLPVEKVVDYGLQLVSALQAIHQSGLVHRDVKPGNIHVCGDNVVLTDFGLSSRPGVLGGVRVGMVEGSLPCLAPESINDGAFGPPSDIYALGVTLYYAVEGRRPFDPGTPAILTEAAIARTPAPTRYAGPLAEVLDLMLENDPGRRVDAEGVRVRLYEVRASALIT